MTFSIIRGYFSEFHSHIRLATPVILGLLGHTMVAFIDNIMVGRLGTTELAAVSLGNSFLFVAMSLGIGFSFAITPLTAKMHTEQHHKRGSEILTHSLYLCLITGTILFFLVIFSKTLIHYLDQPEAVIRLSEDYINIIALSLIPIVLFQGLKQFSDGISQTRIPMIAIFSGNIVNIIVNYFLIFGVGPFEPMGIVGAAIGTLISRLVMLLYLLVVFNRHQKFSKYSIYFLQKKHFDKNLVFVILKNGIPAALQMLFEVIFFASAIWLSGMLGENEQAANQIVLNLTSITFMFAMGLGVVAMIRMGNQLGESGSLNLRKIAFSLFLLISLIDLCFSIIFVVFHDQIPKIYLDSGTNTKDVLIAIKFAGELILIAGLFQIFDGIQAVVIGALRGIQDVLVPTLITFSSYCLIGIFSSYYLSQHTTLGLNGIWIGLFIGVFISSILLFIRFNCKTSNIRSAKSYFFTKNKDLIV